MMPKRLERILALARATAERLKRRSWRWWAITVTLLLLLEEVARSLFLEGATQLLTWGWEGLLWLVARPMGFSGLAIALYVMLLLGVAYWETRPRKEAVAVPKQVEPTPALSDEERELIQQLRTPWNRYGLQAVDRLYSLFSKVLEDIRERHYWASLLDPRLEALQTAKMDLQRVLDPNAPISFEKVQDSFNHMYRTYHFTYMWVAKIGNFELNLSEEPYAGRLKAWRMWHYCFKDKLQDLSQIPNYQGKLAINVNFVFTEQYERQFILEAEGPSEKPPCNLMG